MPDRRRAWARALFLAALDRESRAAYADALAAISSTIAAEPRFREFLANPSVAKDAKASILASALAADDRGHAKGSGAAVFERFCALIVGKGRAALLPQIARAYGAMRDSDEGIARLEVEAAREVDPDALGRIAAAWTSYSGSRTTQAKVKVNSALIAGYRLRAGSLRIDYSIAGRLERLRRELARPLVKSSGAARGEG